MMARLRIPVSLLSTWITPEHHQKHANSAMKHIPRPCYDLSWFRHVMIGPILQLRPNHVESIDRWHPPSVYEDCRTHEHQVKLAQLFLSCGQGQGSHHDVTHGVSSGDIVT